VKITKAVITAAAKNQRNLPLQNLVDRDGTSKSVLQIIVEESLRAGIEDICIVVAPGDEDSYTQAVGGATGSGGNLRFLAQSEPLGYGHAVYCARDFVADEPFLHMVGDHVYISGEGRGCASQLVETAQTASCSVSAVQPTRESQLPLFGAVGGQRVKGTADLFQIERVLEKPTPTEAEQTLMVPGLRAGNYLCFFGMHVFTSSVMDILEEHVRAAQNNTAQNSTAQSNGHKTNIALSPVLNELAGREQYLALEARGRRYPVDARYGLLTAQLALALSGRDRDEVLTGLCELLAQREAQRELLTPSESHHSAGQQGDVPQ
jgi:UTP--glucose-1-phosphate uridylyltransferase